MQYYIFKEACATKETGPAYPQIQKWKPGYDDDKVDSYYSYMKKSKNGRFPDFVPDLDYMIMQGNAKPTDLVSSFVSNGFILTQRLMILFEKYHLPPHKFYPVKILHKQKELNNYYFMHIISNYTDFLDYPNSIFVTESFSKSDQQPIILSSKQDYVEISKNLQNDFFIKKLNYRAISVRKIILNSEFDKTLDLFKIGSFDISYYLSERLKIALLENNITGCDIEATSMISF